MNDKNRHMEDVVRSVETLTSLVEEAKALIPLRPKPVVSAPSPAPYQQQPTVSSKLRSLYPSVRGRSKKKYSNASSRDDNTNQKKKKVTECLKDVFLIADPKIIILQKMY